MLRVLKCSSSSCAKYKGDVNPASGEHWKEHHQQYQQKHHLMMIAIKKLLM